MSADFLSAVLITLSTFFVMSSITGFMPFSPVFFEKKFGENYVGVLTSLPSIAAVFFRIPFGALISRNARFFSMLGAVFYGISFMFLYHADSILEAFLVRIFQGACIVLYFVSVLSVLGALSKNLKNSFFIYNTLLYLPMVYSSLLANNFYYKNSFYAFLYITVVAVIGGLLTLPVKRITLETPDFKTITLLFKDKKFIAYFLALILFIIADAAVYMCLPLRMHGKYMGLYFMLWGALTTLFRVYYAVITLRTEFDVSKYIAGGVLVAGTIVLLEPSLFMLVVSAVLHGWGWAIVDPLIIHQAAEKFSKYPETSFMGSFSISYDLGFLIGPLVFSIVYYNLNWNATLILSCILTFVASHIWQKIK